MVLVFEVMVIMVVVELVTMVLVVMIVVIMTVIGFDLLSLLLLLFLGTEWLMLAGCRKKYRWFSLVHESWFCDFGCSRSRVRESTVLPICCQVVWL